MAKASPVHDHQASPRQHEGHAWFLSAVLSDSMHFLL